jgi:hypothetical protein
MTKIKNTLAYPVKKSPIPADFFIGTDSEDDDKTVSFSFQSVINALLGNADYRYSTSSIPLTAPNGDGYFITNGITDFSSITNIFVSKINLAGIDLTPLMEFMADNASEFILYLVNNSNRSIFAYFELLSVTEETDYFSFNVALAPGENYLGTLTNKDVFTFNYLLASLGELPIASETLQGIVELATAAETIAGTDNTKAVHPLGLSQLLLDFVRKTVAINQVYGTNNAGDQTTYEISTGANLNGTVLRRTAQSQAQALTVADDDVNASPNDLVNRSFVSQFRNDRVAHATLANGGTYAFPVDKDVLIMKGSTVANFTITFPNSTAYKRIIIAFEAGVTNLTFSPDSGDSIDYTPATAKLGDVWTYGYDWDQFRWLIVSAWNGPTNILLPGNLLIEKIPSNTNYHILQVGDIVSGIVQGNDIKAIYLGGNTSLLSSYDLITSYTL